MRSTASSFTSKGSSSRGPCWSREGQPNPNWPSTRPSSSVSVVTSRSSSEVAARGIPLRANLFLASHSTSPAAELDHSAASARLQGQSLGTVPTAATSRARRETLVAVDLDQALVADPKMVGDLVQHDTPHLPAQSLLVSPVQALQRSPVDGDLVREHAAVKAGALGQRDALVEAEQRLAAWWLVLDDDLHVRHL